MNLSNLNQLNGLSEPPIPDSYLDYVDPNIPKWSIVLLFFVGIFGNMLSLAVFNKMNVRQNSTYIYLAILCLVDITTVILGLGDMIILFYFNESLRNQSIVLCRGHTFLLYTSTHWSSFILASVSIDRAIAVKFINYAHKYCRPRTAYKVLGGSFLLAVLLNIHTLFFLGTNIIDQSLADTILENDAFSNNSLSTKYQFHCASEEGLYGNFLYPYFDLIDLLVYTILPFFIMAVCTVTIVKVLYDSKRRLKRMKKKTKALATTTSILHIEETDLIKSCQESGKIKMKKESIKSKATKSETRKNKQTTQLTYTLISINILFVLLLGPISLLRILMSTNPEWNSLKNFASIFYVMAYANHCFNFIFYGLSSKLYREALIKIFYFKK